MLYLSLFILAAVAVLVFKAVRIVPQGYVWTVENFGRFAGVLEPGLHFLMPIYQSIGHKVSMMEQVVEIDTQRVIASDNVPLSVDAVVYFQVVQASKAVYEVENVTYAIVNLVTTSIRSVLGKMELDRALASRAEINAEVLEALAAATTSWGVKVTRVEIKDLVPPSDIANAMSVQMKAEREKRATILEAEAKRDRLRLEAEGAKIATTTEAEGVMIAAKSEAEARLTKAKADAEAINMVGDAISSQGRDAVAYFVAQEYIKTLSQFASSPNQKVLMMPMDTAGVGGSLAGIGEMIRQAQMEK